MEQHEGKRPHSPAAFLIAVNFLAFTRALTFPLVSSTTTVEAGRPSPPVVGMLTILQAILPFSSPSSNLTLDGMNSVVT